MPKIEIEIPDIDPELLVESMAAQVLNAHVTHAFADDVDGDPEASPERVPLRLRGAGSTKIALALRSYLDAKIAELAKTLVLEKFDQVIGERVAAAVDAVLAEGWAITDGYGNARGPRLDLKGHISELLQRQRDAELGKPRKAIIDTLVEKAVGDFIDRELAVELKAARETLRKQLDVMITGKFTETIKSALGLR